MFVVVVVSVGTEGLVGSGSLVVVGPAVVVVVALEVEDGRFVVLVVVVVLVRVVTVVGTVVGVAVSRALEWSGLAGTGSGARTPSRVTLAVPVGTGAGEPPTTPSANNAAAMAPTSAPVANLP